MRKMLWKSALALLLAALLVGASASASLAEELAYNLFEKHSTPSAERRQDITWWLYAPQEIGEDTSMVVFLHGGGEMGNGALSLGLPASMAFGTLQDVPAVVVVPQIPYNTGAWLKVDDALELITAEVMERFGIKPENTALCGFSMGAIGTLDIANRHPGKYRRILVAAGRVNEQVRAASFEGSEVWFFVGRRDYDIRSETIYSFQRLLENAGVPATVTVLETNHLGTEQAVFSDPEVMDWLFTGVRPSASVSFVPPFRFTGTSVLQ